MANVLTTGAVKQREVSDPITTAAAQFWSLTLYDTETRAIIQNRANDSARSGLDTLETNPDGSVDLYFGPAGSAPAGLETNWIETFAGNGFYPMFRIYYPKEVRGTRLVGQSLCDLGLVGRGPL